ncbi:zinc ribbon family protein [Actinomycetospora succinea]|uniref:Zinc ribbon family protein n=1 Tax=Actinomycetospora succinea TaxID=663603 RepID=A0A4R6UIH9_9PSEU|nr:zinc-ribbon domain-containing protein [Actinomycetospora succinea]TDQ46688.1 zinc ribbon family protein [Actinomycetospora succinea]
MIVFGTRRTVTQLALIVLTCANCHRSAANAILKAITKFTLFFIPLFPVRTRYATQCTACGFLMWIEKEQAEQLAQGPAAPPAGPPPMPGQYQPFPNQSAAPGMPGAAPWSAPPPPPGGNGHARYN